MTMETVTVRMSRGDGSTPWGFRLQGGQEFGGSLTIAGVTQGSLADRAGLHEFDGVFELLGRSARSMSHKEAEQLILSARGDLDLVVHRKASPVGAHIWKPTYTPIEQSSTTVTQKSSTINTSGNVPSSMGAHSPGGRQVAAPAPTRAPVQGSGPGYGTSPVKVSLEHTTKETRNIPGYNVTPKPFTQGDRGGVVPVGGQQGGPTVTHNPYNTPMGLYDQQSAAHEYLQQTGGLFGTDPSLAKPGEQPSYLQSQTLRLIQETESHKGGHSPHGHHQHHPPPPAQHIYEDEFAQGRDQTLHHSEADQQSGSFKRLTHALHADGLNETHTVGTHYVPPSDGVPPGVPACDNCGRGIVGVFCKAGGKTLHAECFTCATCGSSLKNTGYFTVQNKLYCEIHARQHQTSQFKAAPPLDPGTFTKSAPMPPRPVKSPEPTKAFYQPEIMAKGPASPVKVPWRSDQPAGYGPGSKTISSFTSTTTQNFQTGGAAPFAPSAPPAGGMGAAPGGAGGRFSEARPQPRRGRGILKQLGDVPRVPVCEGCHREIRGPFVLAMNKTWCPDHFVCANGQCRRQLIDVGFVEEGNQMYCENCFEKYMAPTCAKCNRPVVSDCLNAVEKQWHPECFVCTHCHKPFGNATFYLEDGKPYCEEDWNQLFTTKCVSCLFPIEAGDRWVEALNQAYHSNCFTCTMCQKNLEGMSFYAKGGKPYCKAHA